MTKRQSLWARRLPLAAPVILAGIRTAAAWVIGTATLSTPVGPDQSRHYIFSACRPKLDLVLLFGCVAAAALALIVDRSARARRRRSRQALKGAAPGIRCGIADRCRRESFSAFASAGGKPLVVGTKSFEEQYILGALIEDRLREAGFQTARRDGLGSTVIFDALARATSMSMSIIRARCGRTT